VYSSSGPAVAALASFLSMTGSAGLRPDTIRRAGLLVCPRRSTPLASGGVLAPPDVRNAEHRLEVGVERVGDPLLQFYELIAGLGHGVEQRLGVANLNPLVDRKVDHVVERHPPDGELTGVVCTLPQRAGDYCDLNRCLPSGLPKIDSGASGGVQLLW